MSNAERVRKSRALSRLRNEVTEQGGQLSRNEVTVVYSDGTTLLRTWDPETGQWVKRSVQEQEVTPKVKKLWELEDAVTARGGTLAVDIALVLTAAGVIARIMQWDEASSSWKKFPETKEA